MFHLQILLTALQGLRQNLLRTLLAMLGVIIGVGAVVAAVAILTGTKKIMLEKVEQLGADQLIIINGTDNPKTRRNVPESLTPEDAPAIQSENPDLVVAAVPQYQGVAQVKYYERNVGATILGTTAEYAKINDYHATEGRFINPRDVLGKSMVCVLGHGVNKKLFGALPAVGERVKINGKGFVVVGVMEERGALGFANVDDQITVPISTALTRMFGARNLSMLVVQCSDVERLPACEAATKRTLRVTHRIQAGAWEDFKVYTQSRLTKEFAIFGVILGAVLVSISGISIVVASIGIVNIMLVSVTERTREIGVRIAVGARRLDILKQFLIEASVISLIGGAFGGLCGWAVVNLIKGYTLEILPVYFHPMLLVVALVLAGFVGVVSGIYPAIRAARMDPVSALRFE